MKNEFSPLHAPTCPTQSLCLCASVVISNFETFNLLNFETNPNPALPPIGRIIALQNQFELQNINGAYGLQFDAVNDNTNNPVGYTNLVVRGNRIRPLDGAMPASGLMGIKALSVNNLNIDNNWVDVAVADS